MIICQYEPDARGIAAVASETVIHETPYEDLENDSRRADFSQASPNLSNEQRLHKSVGLSVQT